MDNRKLALAALAFLFCASAVLADPQANLPDPTSAEAKKQALLDEICTKVPCRTPGRITIKIDEKESVAFAIPHAPYVDGTGAIIAYPGEMLVFHVAMDGDALSAPVFVRQDSMKTGKAVELDTSKTPDLQSNAPAAEQAIGDMKANGTMKDRLAKEPPGTLFVYYRQVPDGAAMILEIAHNLSRPLKLDATIAIPTQQGFRFMHSSTCTVLPNLSDIETWGKGLGPVVLEHLHLLPDSRTVNCS